MYAERYRAECSARSRKPAFVAKRSSTTSTSMRCECCARKCGASCSPKLRSTTPENCYARFRSSATIRAALLIALIQTLHHLPTKRQLWSYSGFGIETHSSAEQRFVQGELQRAKKPASIRGLNRNHNHELKNLFKGAATVAAAKTGPFKEFCDALVAKGIRPEMARLTLTRKMAAITLIVWKKGVRFDAQHLKPQTA